MQALFLHNYDLSPFSQKAFKMLALKKLAWHSVEMPMIAPKPDLTPLTGGYRGTPVLQIGADIYVDTARIRQVLDAVQGEPALAGIQGELIDSGLACWGEAFFEAGLLMAVHEFADQWDEDFFNDREAVFARLDFDEVKTQFAEACSTLRYHAAAIDRQLADGRKFLLGERPGLADIHAWAVLNFTRNAMPVTNDLLQECLHLPPWEQRMVDLGEGERVVSCAADAFAAARDAIPQGGVPVDNRDPLLLARGQKVVVSATGSDRGDSHGTLVGLDVDEIVIDPGNTDLGTLHVHFPRHGYRVAPVNAD
jgi:glutathione S-transferase